MEILGAKGNLQGKVRGKQMRRMWHFWKVDTLSSLDRRNKRILVSWVSSGFIFRRGGRAKYVRNEERREKKRKNSSDVLKKRGIRRFFLITLSFVYAIEVSCSRNWRSDRIESEGRLTEPEETKISLYETRINKIVRSDVGKDVRKEEIGTKAGNFEDPRTARWEDDRRWFVCSDVGTRLEISTARVIAVRTMIRQLCTLPGTFRSRDRRWKRWKRQTRDAILTNKRGKLNEDRVDEKEIATED